MRDVHDLTAGDPPVVADCTQDDILQAVHALAAAVDDLTAAVNTSHAALVASFDALAAAIVDNNSHDAAAIVDGNHTASLTETLNNNIHDATFHKLNETVNYLAVHTFSTANDETVRTVRTSIVPTNTRVYMYIFIDTYIRRTTRGIRRVACMLLLLLLMLLLPGVQSTALRSGVFPCRMFCVLLLLYVRVRVMLF